MGWLWITIAISTFCLASQAQEQRHWGSHCFKELRFDGTLNYPEDKPSSFLPPPNEFGSGVDGSTNCLFYGRVSIGYQVILAFSRISLGLGSIRVETKASSFSNWRLNTTILVTARSNTITINIRDVRFYRIVVPNTVISFILQYWNTNVPTATTPTTAGGSTTSSSSSTTPSWLFWWLLNQKPHYPPGGHTQAPWQPWPQPTQPSWPPWPQPTQPTWPPWTQPTQWIPTVSSWPPWSAPSAQSCQLPHNGWEVSWCTNDQRKGSYCEFRCRPTWWGGGGGQTTTSYCTDTYGTLAWQPPLGFCGSGSSQQSPFFP